MIAFMDVIVACDNQGAVALPCHVLTHSEVRAMMPGMVTLQIAGV
jgi:hypothetical protein